MDPIALGKPASTVAAGDQKDAPGPTPDELRRAAVWRALESDGVAYPPFADECGQQDGVRTNYALVSKQARAVFLSLDNGAERSPRYEGFSPAEMGFAEDVLEYARKESLPLLVVAHIPPNTLLNEGGQVPPRPPSVEQRVRAQRSWIVGLRERHPNTLFVFGHLHPLKTRMDPADADVDLDGASDGKREIDEVILGGQRTASFTKITLYEHGQRIEDFHVEGAEAPDPHGPPAKETGEARRVGELWLDERGELTDGPASLGAATGVVYGTADLQWEKGLDAYFQALARDAQGEDLRGMPIYYLHAGDENVRRDHLPVHLPQHEHLLWTPGNHDYLSHASLGRVVDFLQPADGPVKFSVDYLNQSQPSDSRPSRSRPGHEP